jgi:hypothetical protein
MGRTVAKDGVPGGIRTHDPLLRRQPLYPTELQGLKMVGGFANLLFLALQSVLS